MASLNLNVDIGESDDDPVFEYPYKNCCHYIIDLDGTITPFKGEDPDSLYALFSKNNFFKKEDYREATYEMISDHLEKTWSHEESNRIANLFVKISLQGKLIILSNNDDDIVQFVMQYLQDTHQVRFDWTNGWETRFEIMGRCKTEFLSNLYHEIDIREGGYIVYVDDSASYHGVFSGGRIIKGYKYIPINPLTKDKYLGAKKSEARDQLVKIIKQRTLQIIIPPLTPLGCRSQRSPINSPFALSSPFNLSSPLHSPLVEVV